LDLRHDQQTSAQTYLQQPQTIWFYAVYLSTS